MDLSLFSSVIRNLIHTNVTVASEETLSSFQFKFCYDENLQPIFRAETMKRLLSDMEEGVIYEFRDALGICILFFLLDGQEIVVGPFVRRELSELKLRETLMANGMPASYAESVKLYYSAFPLLSATHAINTVTACIHAFSGTGVDLRLCRIDD